MSAPSPWLLVGAGKPQATVTLFCFGAAGTGGSQFLTWNRLTPSWLRVASVQLPGREERYREPLVKDVKELAASIALAIASSRDMRRFALFGHSFGGLLAFEVAHCLRGLSVGALQLFIAARAAPHIQWSHPKTYLLPEDEFLEALKRYGGIDKLAIGTQRSRDFFLPVIRSDLEANSEYVHKFSISLAIPITVSRGREDVFCTEQEILAWHTLTSDAFSSVQCEGGHFFFRRNPRLILNSIVSELGRYATTPPFRSRAHERAT